MNYKFAFFATLVVSGAHWPGSWGTPQQEKPRTPADGRDIPINRNLSEHGPHVRSVVRRHVAMLLSRSAGLPEQSSRPPVGRCR